jgi:4-hydroxy-tetrahydrodipicolinate synthase
MSETAKISGLFVPLLTPFYKGKFDAISMKRLIKRLDPHVDGYIPCLSSGEGKELSTKEWEEIVTVVATSTQKPVFTGILRTDEKSILSLIKKANALPCTGIVVPTLYQTDKDNVAYIHRVIKASKKPIILYNTEDHPIQSTNTVVKLDSLSNSKIVGIKDSSMNISFFQKLVDLNRKHILQMNVFQGMEHLLLQSAGCSGYILSLLNIEPELCRTMLTSPKKTHNQKILTKFSEYNLGGDWYITLKALLYARGTIRSAEQVNQTIQV